MVHLFLLFSDTVTAAIFTSTRVHNFCYEESNYEKILDVLMEQSCLATFLLIIIMIYLVKENLKLYNVDEEEQSVRPKKIKTNMHCLYALAGVNWTIVATVRSIILFGNFTRQVQIIWMLSLKLVQDSVLLATFLVVITQLQMITQKFSKTIQEYLEEGSRDINRQRWIIGSCFFARMCVVATIVRLRVANDKASEG